MVGDSTLADMLSRWQSTIFNTIQSCLVRCISKLHCLMPLIACFKRGVLRTEPCVTFCTLLCRWQRRTARLAHPENPRLCRSLTFKASRNITERAVHFFAAHLVASYQPYGAVRCDQSEDQSTEPQIVRFVCQHWTYSLFVFCCLCFLLSVTGHMSNTRQRTIFRSHVFTSSQSQKACPSRSRIHARSACISSHPNMVEPIRTSRHASLIMVRRRPAVRVRQPIRGTFCPHTCPHDRHTLLGT
jgi:hypothetical protein